MTAAPNRRLAAHFALGVLVATSGGALASPLCTHDGTAFRCVDPSGSRVVDPPPDFRGRSTAAPRIDEALQVPATDAARATPGGAGRAKPVASAPAAAPGPAATPRAATPVACTGNTEGVRCQ